MATSPPTVDYSGILTKVTNDYINSFSLYAEKFMHYGKEIFMVLLALNITWICLWYAFDKDSLAAGMSDFLKKFTIAMIFYAIMINPSYMGSLIASATQMGLDVTGQKSLDPSYIVTIGANVGLEALASITHLSIMFNAASIFMTLIVFFVIQFCFMSVALQVAVTQVIATAVAVFSCFTLGFSALGATSGMARKSIDALICACFKLLGYYVVIGVSIPVFKQWNSLKPSFFQDTRQILWLCTATLMFWLLSKSMASVFERMGGGLVGETAGVDFAALAFSAAKTAVMASAKSSPQQAAGAGAKSAGGEPSLRGPSPSSPVSPPNAARGENAANDSFKNMNKMAEGSSMSNSSSQPSHSKNNGSGSNASNSKVVNIHSQAGGAENKRTFPNMSKENKQYKTG